MYIEKNILVYFVTKFISSMFQVSDILVLLYLIKCVCCSSALMVCNYCVRFICWTEFVNGKLAFNCITSIGRLCFEVCLSVCLSVFIINPKVINRSF